MIPQNVQRRRRQICSEKDRLRRMLQDIRQCRVMPGELGPAELEEQLQLFLDDLGRELDRLDWLVDCVREIGPV